MKHDYQQYIKSTRDFPKEGVVYRDFTPLLENGKVFNDAISDIMENFKGAGYNKIAAIEAKGFILGGAMAVRTGLPLALIRKPHLIPGEVIKKEFTKEYGKAEYQIKKNIFSRNDRILLVYDIMAGPGATGAAIDLIESTGARVIGCAYITELEYLGGREKLEDYKLFSLVKIKNK